MGALYENPEFLPAIDDDYKFGTGFLIAADLVLTSAHNIYSKKFKFTFENLIFYPGVSGPLSGSTGYKVVGFRFPHEYTLKGDQSSEYDYALLKLERKVPINRFIELGVNFANQKEEIGIIGYQGPDASLTAAHQSYLWKNQDQKIESKFLHHKLSTFKGNSGSPIFVKRGDRLFAVAVHKGALTDESYNVARLITEDMLINLIFWER